MTAESQRPGWAPFNFDYWLRRCEGFRVDSPDGRVGFVEELRYASHCDRPDAIAVGAGLLGRLLLIVPVEEIAEILPNEERIVLHRSPRPTATERLEDGRGAARGKVEGVAAGGARLEAQEEVKAVIKRLAGRIGLRSWRGGEREMTPSEASAETPAEEQAGEQPAAEEAPAEEAEAAPAEEPAAEEPPAEEPTAERETTA